jgi:hypothetical protein
MEKNIISSVEKLDENKILVMIYSIMGWIFGLILICYLVLTFIQIRSIYPPSIILGLMLVFFIYMYINSALGVKKGKKKAILNLLALHSLNLTLGLFSGDFVLIIFSLVINGIAICIGIILLKKLF